MATKVKGHIEQIQINTANPNLDGTGTIKELITGAHSDEGDFGTLIQEVTIEGVQSAFSAGMIRFYLGAIDGGPWKLIREVEVYPNLRAGFQPTYNALVLFDFILATGWRLGVSTENGEEFVITAFGQDIVGYV